MCPSLLLGTKAVFYPPDLIKTRLQAQTHNSPFDFKYKGPRDACRQILRKEGIRGLYRGFGVSNLSVLVMQLYITTFELTKMHLNNWTGANRTQSKAANLAVSSAAGTVAAVVAQTIGTPARVLLQNIQCGSTPLTAKPMMGKALSAAASPQFQLNKRRIAQGQSRQMSRGTAALRLHPAQWLRAGIESSSIVSVTRSLVQAHGAAHLWRGFSGSVLMYAPTSAIWWALYPTFHDRVSLILNGHEGPSATNNQTVEVLTKAVSGSLAAGVTCLATNPLDVIRTRHNLLANASASSTSAAPRAFDVMRSLVREEGVAGLYRGLSMRAVKFCLSSFVLVVIYEGVKEQCRLS